MRLGAAIQGSLREYMKRELNEATEGVVRGLNKAANSLKAVLRQQVTGAGLGRKVGNAWRSKFYVNKRIDAAALVFSKAPMIHSAFNYGVTIRAKSGKALAIPVKPRRFGRYRLWPQHIKDSLIYVPGKNGKPAMLVTRRVPRKNKNSGAKARKLSFKQEYKVEFILVRSTTLKKALDVERAEQRILNALPAMIRNEMKD